MAKYNQYMRDQVTELLTNYGKIDILWFDFSINSETQTHHKQSPVYPWMWNNSTKEAEQWEADKMIALIRSLQPHIILNNRIGLDPDIFTPEQTQPTKWVTDKETGEKCTWRSARPSPAPGVITGMNPPGNLPRCSSICWSIPWLAAAT